MQHKAYRDGMDIMVNIPLADLPEKYRTIFSCWRCDYAQVRHAFLAGLPVPKGVTVKYKDKIFSAGECRFPAKKPEPKPEPKPEEAKAPERPAEAPQTPPSLDMFDNTNPDAPRTIDQNNAFWGLMEGLAKLTFKTPEEMKCIIVRNALGENKGTSKLTIAEMDKVINYVKQTIALFGAKVPTVENGKVAKA